MLILNKWIYIEYNENQGLTAFEKIYKYGTGKRLGFEMEILIWTHTYVCNHLNMQRYRNNECMLYANICMHFLALYVAWIQRQWHYSTQIIVSKTIVHWKEPKVLEEMADSEAGHRKYKMALEQFKDILKKWWGKHQPEQEVRWRYSQPLDVKQWKELSTMCIKLPTAVHVRIVTWICSRRSYGRSIQAAGYPSEKCLTHFRIVRKRLKAFPDQMKQMNNNEMQPMVRYASVVPGIWGQHGQQSKTMSLFKNSAIRVPGNCPSPEQKKSLVSQLVRWNWGLWIK